jgi:hypothetical protein
MKRTVRFFVSAAVPVCVVIALAGQAWYQERLWRPGLDKPPDGEFWRALASSVPLVAVVVLLLLVGGLQARRRAKRGQP